MICMRSSPDAFCADSGYQGPKFAKALAKVLPHRTHTGKAAGLSQARERWRVYDVAREVQAAC